MFKTILTLLNIKTAAQKEIPGKRVALLSVFFYIGSKMLLTNPDPSPAEADRLIWDVISCHMALAGSIPSVKLSLYR